MKIEDGTGKGFLASVNDHALLGVNASGHSAEHEVSLHDQLAFYANTADTADTLTLADATSGPMLYLANDDAETILVVEVISASASAAGSVLKVTSGPTLATIGANNTHVPVNSSFGSSKVAEVTCFNWDGTGTVGMTGLSGGKIWKTYILPVGLSTLPVEGCMILSAGDSMMISCANNTGSALEFEAGIRFYMDDI